jgi:parvulin-like peptidyl-prolyl isomerase
MTFQRLTGLAFVVMIAAGCQSQRPSLAATTSSAAAAPAAPQVTRSQKPEGQQSSSGIRQTVFEAVPDGFHDAAEGRVAVRIRAQVNGIPILDDEVRDACYPMLLATLSLPEPERSARQAEVFRSQLQQLIDREVMLQDALARLAKNGSPYMEKLKTAASKEFDKVIRSMKTRSGCKTDDELKNLLQSQGQTIEGIRRQVERNFMAREYMKSRIYPAVERIGHEQIVEFYQNHAADFQTVDSVTWQDIFIDASKYPSRADARRAAEQVVARARGGEDFSKLSRYDNGDSSYRNGEGFGQRHGEIRPPEAEPILFHLKDGEVGPIVELPTGFHVVRLVKRLHAGLLPLDEKLQGEIRRKLQNEVAEKESKRLLAELRQKASIEIAPSAP